MQELHQIETCVSNHPLNFKPSHRTFINKKTRQSRNLYLSSQPTVDCLRKTKVRSIAKSIGARSNAKAKPGSFQQTWKVFTISCEQRSTKPLADMP